MTPTKTWWHYPALSLAFIFALFIALPWLSGRLIGSSLLINKAGFSRRIYADNNELLKVTLSADEKYRIFIPLSEISETLKRATILQEDRYFYWHPGINPYSLLNGLWSTYTGKRRIGGSTISMQLARLRFGIRSKNITGKIQQIFYALLLEALYSKDQILEAYLNSAPYGGNVEGIEAAALIYFGKKSSAINCAESISLAIIPQNPNKRLPELENEIHIQAAIRLAEAMKSDSSGLCSDPRQFLFSRSFKRSDLPAFAPHFVERAIHTAPQQTEIYTTLNPDLQKLVERLSAQFLNGKDKLGIKNTAVLLVENNSLEIKAYLGSADFWSKDILGQNDGIIARRSPGSALKPFLYAIALDQGLIHPGSLLKDTEFSRAAYNPENFEKDFVGPINATDALIRSRNIPAVALLNQISPRNFYDFLKTAGIAKLKPVEFYGLSLILGGVEVSIEELAKLYASLANNGELRSLSLIKAEESAAKKKIIRPFSAESAFLIQEMLKENPRPVTTFDSNQLIRDLAVPWKTGTSFGFRDAWAAGIAGQYTLIVWMGNFDGSSNPAFLGRDSAGILFFKIVDALYASNKLSDYIQAKSLNIKKVKTCAVSGELPGPHCHKHKDSWFIPGVSPIKTCRLHREIFLNPQSGLRTCSGNSENSKAVVEEFWSSDLMDLFKRSGLPRKQPPDFEADCQQRDHKGSDPLISSPQQNINYQLQSSSESIPLLAVTDADSQKSYWFADDVFIGEARPSETIFWQPAPGNYLVRVVDSQGRSNQVQIKVELAAALRR